MSGPIQLASSSLRLPAVADLDAVVALGLGHGDVAGVEVALNEIERTFGRWPVTAATAGLDADQVAGSEAIGVLLVGADLPARCGLHDRDAPGLGLLAALHAPWRAQRAIEIGAEVARRHDAVGLAEAQ